MIDPFRPFRICVSDGSVYDVRHSELVTAMEGAVRIGLPNAAIPGRFNDQFVIVSLLHISRLELVAM